MDSEEARKLILHLSSISAELCGIKLSINELVKIAKEEKTPIKKKTSDEKIS